MWLTAACTGLRSCELSALQWGDLDFDKLTVKVQRSFVQGELNGAKTRASAATLPLDAGLVGLLKSHRERSRFVNPDSLVFSTRPTDSRGGHQRSSRLISNLRRSGRAFSGKVGWHTLRHSFSTLLRGQGTDVKVQQSCSAFVDRGDDGYLYSAVFGFTASGGGRRGFWSFLQVVPTRTRGGSVRSASARWAGT